MISQLTTADVAEYRRLRLRAQEEHPAAFRSSAEEEARKPLSWWQERLDDRRISSALFFGAWTQERMLIGTAGLTFETRPKTRHTAKVIGMYVAPEHTGHGIGARLLTACVDCARADPAMEFLYLTVTNTNEAAIRLYERAGFRAYGSEPGSMKIDQRTFDKLMMYLALRRD